jgi:peptidoglycan-associated lipoprotein
MAMFSIRAAAACAITAALAACTTTTVLDPPQPVVIPPTPAAVSEPLPPPKPVDPPRVIMVLPPHLDPSSELYGKRSVFFDFDESVLRPEDQPLVDAHGIYLRRYPELHIRVTGNTDERGGREYNLALGERRAQAVKAAMQLMGVLDEQIETASYGKERPRALGDSEEARALNRRADIVYLVPTR